MFAAVSLVGGGWLIRILLEDSSFVQYVKSQLTLVILSFEEPPVESFAGCLIGPYPGGVLASVFWIGAQKQKVKT